MWRKDYNCTSQHDDKKEKVPELDRHKSERVKGPVLFLAAFSINSRFSRGWMIGMHAKSNLEIKNSNNSLLSERNIHEQLFDLGHN